MYLYRMKTSIRSVISRLKIERLFHRPIGRFVCAVKDTNRRNQHRYNGVPVKIIYFGYSFPSSESIKIGNNHIFSLLFRFLPIFSFPSIEFCICFCFFFHDIVSSQLTILVLVFFSPKIYNNCNFKLILSIYALVLLLPLQLLGIFVRFLIDSKIKRKL